MSTTTKTKEVSMFASALITMPDGKSKETTLEPKVFSSGREGFYAQITSFVYEGVLYGGQIQVWKKTPKVK